MAKRRRKVTKKRGRMVEQVVTTRDRVVFDGKRPRPDPFAPRRFEPLEPPTAPEAMARRRAVFTTEVTPAIYPHPTREFYHRGNRPPFMQPSPTELQGFESAEPAHTELGDRAAHDAAEAAKHGADLASDGDCNTARRFLNQAHGMFGHAVAHSLSGGRVASLTMTSSTIDRAEKHYAARCPVRKKR